MSYKTDNWKEYNNIITNLKVNDAVKVTSSNWESFWVEITNINENDIIGTVQNNLIKEHEYKIYDCIKFEIKHIKEVNKKENRFNIQSNELKNCMNLINSFKNQYGRFPTEEEFSEYLNIRYISID